MASGRQGDKSMIAAFGLGWIGVILGVLVVLALLLFVLRRA